MKKISVIDVLLVVMVVAIIALPVLVLSIGLFAIANEDEMLKHELNNEYIDNDYLGWKLNTVDGFGELMIPNEWSIKYEDEIVKLFNSNEALVAQGCVKEADGEYKIPKSDLLRSISGKSLDEYEHCGCFDHSHMLGSTFVILDDTATDDYDYCSVTVCDRPSDVEMFLVFVYEDEVSAREKLDIFEALVYYVAYSPQI